MGVCACSGRALVASETQGRRGGRFSKGILLALVAAVKWMGCCVIAPFTFRSAAVTYLYSPAGACKHSQIIFFLLFNTATL